MKITIFPAKKIFLSHDHSERNYKVISQLVNTQLGFSQRLTRTLSNQVLVSRIFGTKKQSIFFFAF